jgi:hypothetical protein
MMAGNISHWTDSASGQNVLLSMMKSEKGKLVFDRDFAKKVQEGKVSELDMLGRAEDVVRAQGLVPGAEKDAILRSIAKKFKPDELVRLIGEDVIRDLGLRKMEKSQGNFIDELMRNGASAKEAQALLLSYENPEIMQAIKYNDATSPWRSFQAKDSVYRNSLKGLVEYSAPVQTLLKAEEGAKNIAAKIADTLGTIPRYWGGGNNIGSGDSRQGFIYDDTSKVNIDSKNVIYKSSDFVKSSDELLSRHGDVTVNGRKIRQGLSATKYAAEEDFMSRGFAVSDNYFGKNGRGLRGLAGDIWTGARVVWNTPFDKEEAAAIAKKRVDSQSNDKIKKYQQWLSDTYEDRKKLGSDINIFRLHPNEASEIGKAIGVMSDDEDIRQFAEQAILSKKNASKSQRAWDNEIERDRATMAKIQLSKINQDVEGFLSKEWDSSVMSKATYSLMKELVGKDGEMSNDDRIAITRAANVDRTLAKDQMQGKSFLADINFGADAERVSTRAELSRSKNLNDWINMDKRGLTLNALDKLTRIVTVLEEKGPPYAK